MLSEFTNRYSGWFDDEDRREFKVILALAMDDLPDEIEEHENQQRLEEYLEDQAQEKRMEKKNG